MKILCLWGVAIAALSRIGSAQTTCSFAFERSVAPSTANYVSTPSPLVIWAGRVRTRDAGKSWEVGIPRCQAIRLPFQEDPDKDETIFVTPLRGWLRGIGSTWQTEDGGETWLELEGGALSAFGFSRTSGWMLRETSSAGALYTTADSGETWSMCGAPKRGWLPRGRGLFIGATKTIAVLTRPYLDTYEYSIGISTDGGCSWAPVWIPMPRERLEEVFFLNESQGWTTAYGGLVFRTSDGGVNWQQFHCPDGSAICREVYYSSPAEGYIAAKPPDPDRGYTGLMLTQDSVHWTSIPPKDLTKLPSAWTYGSFVAALFQARK